jgi:hypothetical protein
VISGSIPTLGAAAVKGLVGGREETEEDEGAIGTSNEGLNVGGVDASVVVPLKPESSPSVG